MKVYLAGPDVFYHEAKRSLVVDNLKYTCGLYGLEGVFPLDNELAFAGEVTKREQALRIKQENLDLIRMCDGVLANYTPFRGVSMDAGTAYEVGFAEALGKHVIGYIDDEDLYNLSYLDRVLESEYASNFDDCRYIEDMAGITIENFDLIDNLMLTADIKVYPCIDTACQNLRELLDEKNI